MTYETYLALADLRWEIHMLMIKSLGDDAGLRDGLHKILNESAKESRRAEAFRFEGATQCR